MKRKIHIGLLALSLVLLFAESSYALEMEYYTYGSFDQVVSAFKRAALIFGDNGYKTLFFTIIAAGILGGASSTVFNLLRGGKGGTISTWAIPVGLGVMIFTAFIVPKGTLHIYDPVKNKTESVGSIPDGLVAIFGATNLIERGLVDIIETSNDPVGYTKQAGGIGFDMLYNVHSKGVLLDNHYIHDSLRRYTEDCVFFELLRPGTNLSRNQVNSNNDFMTIYQEAASPSIFTVYYKDEPSWREGKTQSCQEAFLLLATDIVVTSQYSKVTKARCAEIGFDPTIPAEFQLCKQMFSDFTSWFEGAAWEQVNFFRQTLIGQTFNDALISASPDTSLAMMASRNAGTSMYASGAMANAWIPTIRGILISSAVMLTPFLVLLIPTPLVGRAVSLIAGLSIWVMAWGIIDAALHSAAINFSYQVFEEIRQNQLGLVAITNFGTSSLKALAAFGAVRWSGLMLATVVTGMLVRFGGHALALMASGITSPVQQASSSAGMTTQTPEGSAGELKALEHAPPTWANAFKFDYNTRVGAKGFSEMSNTASAIKQQDIYGGDPMGKAGFDTAGQKAEVGAYGSSDRKAQSLGQNIESTLGSQAMDRAIAGKYFGNDIEKLSQWRQTGMRIDKEMASQLNKEGFTGIEEGMRADHRIISFDETGQIKTLAAGRDDGTKSVSYRDGMKTTNTASGGIITQAIAGPDGSNIMTTQRGVLDMKTEAGRALAQEMKSQYHYARVSDGQRFEITRGADGQISTALFQSGAGSKEVDTFTRETGWLKSHTEKESVNTRNEYSSGTQITAGNTISGTDGVTTYDASKMTLMTRIEGGDIGVANDLTKGSPANQKINTEARAGQWAKEMQTFGNRTGMKYDEASAGANIEMGLKAVGIGGGIDATVRTGSKDASSFNIMAGSMQTVIENARATAGGRRLTEEQAIFQDVRTFHETVKNEFLKTKPVLDSNKHHPQGQRTERIPLDEAGN